MIPSNSLIRRSVRVYETALRLYPLSFRREFGPSMRSAFACWLSDQANERGAPGVIGVWCIAARELLPTVLREHAAVAGRQAEALLAWRPAFQLARVALAGIIVMGVFVTLVHFARRPADLAVVSFWFVLMAGGMARARGRGSACDRNAMIGSAAGIGLPLIWAALTESSSPSILAVGPLLIASGITVALILSSTVRVIVEGIGPVAPAPALPARSSG